MCRLQSEIAATLQNSAGGGAVSPLSEGYAHGATQVEAQGKKSSIERASISTSAGGGSSGGTLIRYPVDLALTPNGSIYARPSASSTGPAMAQSPPSSSPPPPAPVPPIAATIHTNATRINKTSGSPLPGMVAPSLQQEIPESVADHNTTVAALVAAIAGSAAGIFLAVGGLGLFLWMRKRRQRRENEQQGFIVGGVMNNRSDGGEGGEGPRQQQVAVGQTETYQNSNPNPKNQLEPVTLDKLHAELGPWYALGLHKRESEFGAESLLVGGNEAAGGEGEKRSGTIDRLHDLLQPEEIQILKRPDGTPWKLGSGSFGAVFRGLRDGVQPVAVKVVPGVDDCRTKEDFWREVSLLRACRDTNIVQFIGASISGSDAFLITELMELGDLWRATKLTSTVTGERIFAWWTRGAKVMLDVARGLHFLHSHKIIHLDIKSANVLLTRDGTAKIADVGLARFMSRSHFSAWGGGTFAWSAPEVLAGRQCTEKADIYSWGVVLWEICTGESPVRGAMRPLTEEDCPSQLIDLHARCVSEDPSLRPTAKEIVGELIEIVPAAKGGCKYQR